MASEEIDTTFGQTRTKNAIELRDAGRKGVFILGSEGFFDGKGFSWFMRGFFGL